MVPSKSSPCPGSPLHPLTRPETEGLSLAEVNLLLIGDCERQWEIRRLKSEIPTVLLGHLMIDNAAYGAERLLAVGKGFTIPILY